MDDQQTRRWRIGDRVRVEVVEGHPAQWGTVAEVGSEGAAGVMRGLGLGPVAVAVRYDDPIPPSCPTSEGYPAGSVVLTLVSAMGLGDPADDPRRPMAVEIPSTFPYQIAPYPTSRG